MLIHSYTFAYAHISSSSSSGSSSSSSSSGGGGGICSERKDIQYILFILFNFMYHDMYGVPDHSHPEQVA